VPAATDSKKPASVRSDRRSAARLATLIAVPVTVVLLAVAVLAERHGGSGAEPLAPASSAPATAKASKALPSVKVAPPPALSAAQQRACQDLISALPTDLGDLPARPVDSSSPYVAAWGEPAVTLRCGVPRPPSFIATADVQQINGVTWFPERRGANHYRFPIQTNGVYRSIAALLELLEEELGDRDVTVHFGWPTSSWLDRMATGVFVWNLLRLPQLFPCLGFSIAQARGPARGPSAQEVVARAKHDVLSPRPGTG